MMTKKHRAHRPKGPNATLAGRSRSTCATTPLRRWAGADLFARMSPARRAERAWGPMLVALADEVGEDLADARAGCCARWAYGPTR